MSSGADEAEWIVSEQGHGDTQMYLSAKASDSKHLAI